MRQPVADVFRRTDLIYGTEIGGWRNGHRYDGHPLTASPVVQQLAVEAKISVVRWMPWKRFSDLGGDMSDEEFNNIIDNIHKIGALPIIKLPPAIRGQCATAPDVGWLKEIIRRAGSRVILYEFGNEPNWMCGWDAGTYARQWNQVVPELRRYARSLGFEVYIGGPAWAWPELPEMETFLWRTKAEFERTGNTDVVPSFLSFHTFASARYLSDSNATILSRVVSFGEYISQLRASSRNIMGYEIPVANTEWNFTVDEKDKRDRDEAFIKQYTQGMLRGFREHGLWLAVQFTFASNNTNVDMVDMASLRPKPQYYAFKEISTSEGR